MGEYGDEEAMTRWVDQTCQCTFSEGAGGMKPFRRLLFGSAHAADEEILLEGMKNTLVLHIVAHIELAWQREPDQNSLPTPSSQCFWQSLPPTALPPTPQHKPFLLAHQSYSRNSYYIRQR